MPRNYNRGGGYRNDWDDEPRGFSRGNNRGGGRPTKHTGAKSGVDKNGNPYVSGWNVSKRRGMCSVFARPYKGTSEHKSKTGRLWHNWFVTVTFKDQGTEMNTSGLYDPQSGKVIIPKLGWVMNPRAPRGGYCGTFKDNG